ncbi:hypothetical protein [Streptomonospora nanhaiensis]|uniref:hypothetical protein n=1 Tax=Streptomonospora nanhaiensis TaxID=1323731 RepID=UPI001C389A44|nr:hypothetical protein [Streptomonospora nanhaiensis]MBV2364281.1 hypothetical protein [Streptomonospora nanhaiensis]
MTAPDRDATAWLDAQDAEEHLAAEALPLERPITTVYLPGDDPAHAEAVRDA